MMNEGALRELPRGWVWMRFAEAIEKVPLTDKKLKQSEYQQKGIFPVIDQGQEFIGGYTDNEDLKIRCENPLIIFGDHTKVFKYVNFDFVAGADGIKVIKPDKSFYPKLFYNFIQIIPLPDKGYARHFQFLEKSFIPLPPFPEQRAIVSKIEQLFSDLDNGIQNFKKAQAQLKLYRQSVLKAACEGKLVPTEAELAHAEGRDYEAVDVLLERILGERREKWNGKGKYKEPAAPDTSGLPALPEGWSWTTLEQLSWDSGYGTSEKCDYNFSGPSVLRIPNISEGRITLNDIKFASESTNLNETESLAYGDMLVIRTNGSKNLIGRAGVVTQNFNKSYFFASYLIRFRIVEFGRLPIWLSSIWHTPRIRSWIESVAATSAGQYNVSMSTLNKLPLELPPIAEQCRIVAEVKRRLSLSDKMEETIAESLQKAEALRQSILKKAFEGKLLNERELEEARNSPDWEPAEKLLERIKAEKTNIKANNKDK